MASTLPQEVAAGRAVSGAIGRSLLDVLTSGMYSDPRMALREYVQNSVDSIDLATEQGLYSDEKPRVQITLDELVHAEHESGDHQSQASDAMIDAMEKVEFAAQELRMKQEELDEKEDV